MSQGHGIFNDFVLVYVVTYFSAMVYNNFSYWHICWFEEKRILLFYLKSQFSWISKIVLRRMTLLNVMSTESLVEEQRQFDAVIALEVWLNKW